MEQSFEGKTAVITGGTSGIGRAVAKNLAQNRARVVVAGRDEEKGKETEQALRKSNQQVQFIKADISLEEEVISLFEKTKDTFSQADILFNNAAVEGMMAPVTEFPSETCEELLRVNVKGPFLCSKHAIPDMLEKGGGTIVNTASFVGTTIPFPMGVMYGATKAAVLSMTAALAEGYGDNGIRVFAVCPWMTETPMLERLTGGDPEIRSQLRQINPSGDFASADEISQVVIEMLGGDKRYSSGEAYLVDSGAETQQVLLPYQVAG